MQETRYSTLEQLEAGLDEVERSPKRHGVLRLIVARPAVDARETPQSGVLDVADGLIGDGWKARSSSRTPDGSPHPDRQITIINARALGLLASGAERQSLAGDQLALDLDLSVENLPPGTRLEVGDALLEVTAEPHTGCRKFAERFGTDASRWLASAAGKRLRLRGIYAKVVRSGAIRLGDAANKLG